MAPPEWAYHVENFCLPPNDELVCSICHNVLCNPVQSPCQHVFCESCIIRWLPNNKNCPFCHLPLTPTQISNADLSIKNSITKMKVRCHNFERGCAATMPLESIEYHIKCGCLYETVKCKNDPCEFMDQRITIQFHEAESCIYRLIFCRICNLYFPVDTVNNHSCMEELKKAIQESRVELQEYKDRFGIIKPLEPRPSSNATNPAIPISNATNQVTPASNVTNQVTPAANATNQVTPASSATNQVTPASSATNQVTPASSATNQVTPASRATNQVTPASNATNQVTPESNATNWVTTASNETNQVTLALIATTPTTSSLNALYAANQAGQSSSAIAIARQREVIRNRDRQIQIARNQGRVASNAQSASQASSTQTSHSNRAGNG